MVRVREPGMWVVWWIVDVRMALWRAKGWTWTKNRTRMRRMMRRVRRTRIMRRRAGWSGLWGAGIGWLAEERKVS